MLVQFFKSTLPLAFWIGCSLIAADPADQSVCADEPSIEKLQQQIQNLRSPSYRTRQLAIWYLEQNPKRALPLLRAAGQTTDLNVGAEIINMLSAAAMKTDTSVSVEAHEVLKEIAGGAESVTAVSHLALDALASIADRQELLAEQALRELNAQIGELHLNINGAMQNELRDPSIILYVDENFSGNQEHLRLFRFLRSVDTAYLEGSAVSNEMLRQVLAMPALRRLVLKGSKVNNEMLTTIFDVRELEHLELVYCPIDDNALETLVDLPLVGSLRIFGTKLSLDGAKRLKQSLDGLEIYIARGGFLGVQTSQMDLRVSKVVSGSGADEGGIMVNDVITSINGKPIKIFDQLRAELASFAPGEQVDVTVERRVIDAEQPTVKRQLKIILGMQESQSN